MSQGIFVEAALLSIARDRAEMTPEQLAARDAEDAAWAASREERRAAEIAERQQAVRAYFLGMARYDTGRGFGRPYHLAGLCKDGAERGGGRLVHVLPADVTGAWRASRAVCGAEPGPNSVGWSNAYTKEATCPRCLERSRLVAPHHTY